MKDAELIVAALTTDPVILGVHVERLFRTGHTEDAYRVQRLRDRAGALAPGFRPIEVQPRRSELPA